MGRLRQKQEIWGEVLTDKGYMRVPRALRLKRAELGISNNEYAILLDYLDYYTYCGGQNPYGHLAQVNGVSERTVQNTLGKLAQKGLIGRIVKKHPSGRTKGVVFTIEPLLIKLKGRVKDLSPTEGEKNFTYEGEETFTPNTREVGNKSRDSKKSSPEALPAGEAAAKHSYSNDTLGNSLRETRELYALSDAETGPENQKARGRKRKSNSKDPYNSTRWYNEVFSEIYKEASGQPVLTGGREYGAARTYFSRLRELNPLLGAEEIYERASDGARFMLESQLRGGVFGWMHCLPDICMLSGQAQAVDYHLRKTVIAGTAEQKDSKPKQVKISGARELGEKEAYYASEEITRIYGELKGLRGAKGQ